MKIRRKNKNKQINKYSNSDGYRENTICTIFLFLPPILRIGSSAEIFVTRTHTHTVDLSKYNRRPEQSWIERYPGEKIRNRKCVGRATMMSRILPNTRGTSIANGLLKRKLGKKKKGGGDRGSGTSE